MTMLIKYENYEKVCRYDYDDDDKKCDDNGLVVIVVTITIHFKKRMETMTARKTS